LLVTANVVPSLPILIALMMKAMYSSETSVIIKAALRHIPVDGILYNGVHCDGESPVKHCCRLLAVRPKMSSSFELRQLVSKMKSAVFWNATPRVSRKNRRFVGSL
jgi:hypothetical protein